MHKTFKLAILASSVLLSASSAYANEVDVAAGAKAVASVEAKLKAADARLQGETFAFDSELYVKFEQETGSGMVPLTVSGTRYFTDAQGNALIQPTGLIVPHKSGAVIRGNEVIVDFLFSDYADKNWASTKLETNVEKRADLYVFTDPTCGYCQKVEQEVETYRMNGIQVHKIPFPRAGLNIESPGYQKWLAASCSDNPAKAYGEMIMGTDAGKYPVPTDLTQECAKIVAEGYNFGLEVGVQGTPFIYGKTVGGDSVMFNGYNPVGDVAAKLGVLVKPGLSL
jgi:protein-disulfide isomerase